MPAPASLTGLKEKEGNMKGKIIAAASAVLVSGAIGLTLVGGTAHAEPVPAPLYHWCPGDSWDTGWGFNWERNLCHDDWHRDIDGGWHGRDWHPGRGGGHRGPGPGDDHDWDHDQPWPS